MDKILIQADLNLLKVLHVLLEERNVTQAAERLFVSQSAISKSLRRLRQLFGDPLFIRASHGLIATARAEELATSVGTAIEALGGLLQTPDFDPARAHGNLRVAAPESFLLGVIPDLVLRLQKTAPDLSIEALHLVSDHLPMLASGNLDFAIYLNQPYPEGYLIRSVFAAAPRIWFREGHPLAAKKEINLEDTCAYPQVAFHSPNMTAEDVRTVELAMAEQGLDRKVIMSTSHLMIALDVLTKSDALMLGPDYLSGLRAFSRGIASHSVAKIPAFSHLQINLALIQHARTKNSPLHRWFAEEIGKAFAVVSNHQVNKKARHDVVSISGREQVDRQPPAKKKVATHLRRLS